MGLVKLSYTTLVARGFSILSKTTEIPPQPDLVQLRVVLCAATEVCTPSRVASRGIVTHISMFDVGHVQHGYNCVDDVPFHGSPVDGVKHGIGRTY